jgi:DNA-binding transcriptional MerR regulator
MARASSGTAGHVEAIVKTLRRGQRQLARNPRGAIEAAVRQLLAVRPGPAHGQRADGEAGRTYRIDELAQASHTTVRNIRAYQERGLLHPPMLHGRVGIFDDTHVARLKIITSMLERGYTSSHIKEMLTAWESGMDLAHVLGLESVLIAPSGSDEPKIVSLAEARELAGGTADLNLLIDAGLATRTGKGVELRRPQLMAAFAEMRGYGMTTEQLLDVQFAVVPEVDTITEILVGAGARHVSHMFEVGSAPTTGDVAELVDMLQRFRSLAMSSVAATLSDSIDRTIEALLADYLARFVDAKSDAG